MRKGFGLAIKNWRAKSGISQEELAWRAGLHRSYVADIERGSRNVSLQSIEKLAKALEVSLATLFAPLSGTEQSGEVSTRKFQPAGERLEILLVASAPHDTKVILDEFGRNRLVNRIHVLAETNAALELLSSRKAYAGRKTRSTTHLILLDFNRSRIRALELLRAVKSHPMRKRICTIALIEKTKEADAEEAVNAGANASLVKPLAFGRFTALTARLGLSLALENEE